nr:uncharacterized protein LOC129383547 [Dermacentor andersoni]
MKTWFYGPIVIYVLALFCHAKKRDKILQPTPLPAEKTLKAQDPKEIEAFVKELIGGQKRLILSRGMYYQPGFPVCVRSQLINNSQAGYRHNLSYYEKEPTVEKRKEPRIDRNRTYMHVRSGGKMGLLLVINAYVGDKKMDPKVSGRYTILYASKICFVATTAEQANASISQSQGVPSPTANATKSLTRGVPPPTGYSSCSLWRLATADETLRTHCRTAFRLLCKPQGQYRSVFSGMCSLQKNEKNILGPATPKAN